MVDDRVIELYVKNQLFIDPNYSGELLTYKGVKVDTAGVTLKLRELYKPTFGDGRLEAVMTFLDTSERIMWKTQDGTITYLRDILQKFKSELPTQYRAKDNIKVIAPTIYKMIRSSLVCKEGEKPLGIYMGNLICNDFSEPLCFDAMSNLFGLKDTRFIFTAVKKTLNGNMLDFGNKDFERICAIKQDISGVANIIRALGFPYSDYRKFISYGFLVSVDLDDRVYIVRDDFLYCCTVKKFSQLLSNPAEFKQWSKDFSRAYAKSDFAINKCGDWSLLR